MDWMGEEMSKEKSMRESFDHAFKDLPEENNEDFITMFRVNTRSLSSISYAIYQLEQIRKGLSLYHEQDLGMIKGNEEHDGETTEQKKAK